MSSDEGDRKAAAKSHDLPRSKTEQLTVSRQETARQPSHETVSTTRLVALGEGTSKRRPGGTLVSFFCRKDLLTCYVGLWSDCTGFTSTGAGYVLSLFHMEDVIFHFYIVVLLLTVIFRFLLYWVIISLHPAGLL